jgi:two-component system CheB/CheR fusion protein
LSPTTDPSFEGLLEYVRDTRGFDYAGYKRPSLIRRFQNRTQAVGAETWDDYRAYLDEHPDEFNELFDTILINVTGFFRDVETWDLLRDDVIPRLVEQKGARGTIRVWSAGCASGEEAYSAAMLFAEALGEYQFKDRVKVFATDIDEPALTQARDAAYTPKQLADIPDDLREKYFTGVNHLLSFGTRSCTSTRRRKRGSCRTSTSRSIAGVFSCSGRPSRSSAAATCSLPTT